MVSEETEMPDVPTISRDELKRKMDAGDDFVLVEALPSEEYRDAHLPGAVNLPPDRVRERAPELLGDTDADVVVYCANEDCPASPRTVAALREMGYENAVDYEGGKDDWRDAGLPLESGEPEEAAVA